MLSSEAMLLPLWKESGMPRRTKDLPGKTAQIHRAEGGGLRSRRQARRQRGDSKARRRCRVAFPEATSESEGPVVSQPAEIQEACPPAGARLARLQAVRLA